MEVRYGACERYLINITAINNTIHSRDVRVMLGTIANNNTTWYI